MSIGLTMRKLATYSTLPLAFAARASMSVISAFWRIARIELAEGAAGELLVRLASATGLVTLVVHR